MDYDSNFVGASWNTTSNKEEHRGMKGFTGGSKRDYPFEFKGKNNKLYIFESPIDMMSYMTIQKNNNNYINIKDSTFIATWGINSNEMILKYLEKNPNIKKNSRFLKKCWRRVLQMSLSASVRLCDQKKFTVSSPF